MSDEEVIRQREDDDLYLGDPRDQGEPSGRTYMEKRALLAEVYDTVKREAEDDYNHSLHAGISFAKMGRLGVGEWIICRSCGGEVTITIPDHGPAEVEGCNIEPCPSFNTRGGRTA